MPLKMSTMHTFIHVLVNKDFRSRDASMHPCLAGDQDTYLTSQIDSGLDIAASYEPRTREFRISESLEYFKRRDRSSRPAIRSKSLNVIRSCCGAGRKYYESANLKVSRGVGDQFRKLLWWGKLGACCSLFLGEMEFWKLQALECRKLKQLVTEVCDSPLTLNECLFAKYNGKAFKPWVVHPASCYYWCKTLDI